MERLMRWNGSVCGTCLKTLTGGGSGCRPRPVLPPIPPPPPPKKKMAWRFQCDLVPVLMNWNWTFVENYCCSCLCISTNVEAFVLWLSKTVWSSKMAHSLALVLHKATLLLLCWEHCLRFVLRATLSMPVLCNRCEITWLMETVV